MHYPDRIFSLLLSYPLESLFTCCLCAALCLVLLHYPCLHLDDCCGGLLSPDWAPYCRLRSGQSCHHWRCSSWIDRRAMDHQADIFENISYILTVPYLASCLHAIMARAHARPSLGQFLTDSIQWLEIPQIHLQSSTCPRGRLIFSKSLRSDLILSWLSV
jgi:hypothetical protein